MDVAGLLEALGSLAWPLIAAVVLWRLYPGLSKILESRSFTVKVAGMEVSVQQASDQLGSQIEDLRKQVIALRTAAGLDERPQEPLREEAHTSPEVVTKRLLWVDDEPSNNAFEIASLRGQGVEVVMALSTADALSCLASISHGFAAIISDMGRKEEGRFRPAAGLDLIREIRAQGIDTPIFVYSSQRQADARHEDVARAGGNAITASPVELFALLKKVGAAE